MALSMSGTGMLLAACFGLIAIYVGVLADDEFEAESHATFLLEHSFEQGINPHFTKRGTVTIRSLKSGMAHFTPDGKLSEDDIGKLQNLVREKGVYRVRLLSKSLSGQPQYVSSFIKACSLYESQLTDRLMVNVDQSGNILGISITTASPFCHGVEIVQTVSGPVPETQTYIQRMEQEKEKAKGQQSDNRSFLAKYWMYLVPLLIFVMFSNGMDQGNGGGGGSGGGGGRS
ncbi:ER membrane protein complex subunit 10 [Lamellibrachia satsuma]|nr:ER membrane protein complex subunit 10 [Lamellibrachia satsuma]